MNYEDDNSDDGADSGEIGEEYWVNVHWLTENNDEEL